MPSIATTSRVFEREFLGIRARILELAAAFDRVDRAEAGGDADPRREQIARALGVLTGTGPRRAEQVQMIFSLPYREDWRVEG